MQGDADQDGKGGENLGYISAHCFDKAASFQPKRLS